MRFPSEPGARGRAARDVALSWRRTIAAPVLLLADRLATPARDRAADRAAGPRAAAGRTAAAGRAAGAAAAVVPQRRRRRVAERHRHRRHAQLRHRPRTASDFVVFEDGVKQDLTYFTKAQLPIALSLLIDTSASMEDKLPIAQEAAIGFAKRHAARRHRAGHRLRQPRHDPAAVHRRQAGARERHPADRAERLDVAAQRDLHLAQGAEEGARQERRRRAAPGDRGALGRRGHVEPGAVRGSARAGEALRGGRSTPSPSAAATSARAASTKRSSCCGSSRRRPAAAPSSRPRPRSCRRIYSQIADELAAQYALAYSSRNPKRDGQWRRIVVRTTKPEMVARTKQGYYGPTN